MPRRPCPTRRRALRLHHNGFPRAAIDVLEIALQESPERGDWRQLRACLLHAAGRGAEALREIEQAQLLIPLSLKGRLVLASGLWHAGRRNLAVDLYRRLAAGPRLTRCARAAICTALARAGACDEALAVARRAVEAAPDDDEVHYAVAVLLRRLRRPPELIASVLRHAIRLAPDEPRYRRSLALLLLDSGDPDGAYEEVTSLPDDSWSEVPCQACLRKVLDLCCRMGDERRSRLLAAQAAGRYAANRKADATQ